MITLKLKAHFNFVTIIITIITIIYFIIIDFRRRFVRVSKCTTRIVVIALLNVHKSIYELSNLG